MRDVADRKVGVGAHQHVDRLRSYLFDDRPDLVSLANTWCEQYVRTGLGVLLQPPDGLRKRIRMPNEEALRSRGQEHVRGGAVYCSPGYLNTLYVL